ncbi:hypothetical protein FGE12_22115 [Aggregicoccus sp. 17bor-14]|uniref:hypothetical protein n=1 Tax=Myxococcaceae TaxID=31 RepID=UPI00129CEEDF|nr:MULTISPECIES: hypothetical protein [Myxococcaceae]MBF5045114.1 hypothetical protein [Simulacricoccus sp. 17bor-14]MRI90856.1 hypothetical protein [Aggregicoccus sp. 17bor-14]
MLLPLLALLAAAPSPAPAAPTPTPRAAAGAQTVVHAPRLDRLGGVAAFLTRAGALAPLLRPEAWTGDFHPFLPVDPFQPESLRASGIDPAGAATTSLRAEGRITCTRLSDAALFRRAAEAALHAPLTLRRTGALSTLTLETTGLQAGYALQGAEACAFAGPTPEGTKRLLAEAKRLVRASPRPDARLAKLPGALFVLRTGEQEGAVGLEGDAQSLQLQGQSRALPLPPFASAGASPYPAPAAGPQLLQARAHVLKGALPAVVTALRLQVQEACPECPRAALTSVADAVAARLTGQVLVQVAEVRTRGALRSPAARLFAPRQALAAEITDAAAVRAALAPLAKLPGASALPDGWAVALPAGTLQLRVVEGAGGRHLVVGTDAAVSEALVRQLSAAPAGAAPAAAAHGVELALDPRLVARALAQVSLMDVVGSRELAALFAAGAELGPLLRGSEPALGWVDGGGSAPHRFALRWRLAGAP